VLARAHDEKNKIVTKVLKKGEKKQTTDLRNTTLRAPDTTDSEKPQNFPFAPLRIAHN